MEAKEKVVVWGDSLAKGVVWNAERGRHGYCRKNAAEIAGEKLGITIENRAHFGYTAEQGLLMMRRDLSEGMTCDAAVIEFGGNDCNFDWAAISENPDTQHDPSTTPENFVKALRTMIQGLYERGVRPILLTLPPIDAEKYFRFFVGSKLNGANILKWLGDVQQIYRFQEMYSLLIGHVGREMQVRVLDLRARCLENHAFSRMICDDGLHLTEEGQAFVGEQIAQLALSE